MNYFDQEMQPKNTEFAIINELENSLNKLRGFKFAITLVLKVKKNKTKMKQSTVLFRPTQRQKQIFTTQTLIIHSNQYENIRQKLRLDDWFSDKTKYYYFKIQTLKW